MIGVSGRDIKMATSAETLDANITPLKRSEAMSADIVEIVFPCAKKQEEARVRWSGGITDEALNIAEANAWEAVSRRASDPHQVTAVHLVDACEALRAARREILRLRREARLARRAVRAAMLRAAAPAKCVPPCLSRFAGRLIEQPIPSEGWPCVYFLLSNNTVVYVGQTKCLSMRIAFHATTGKSFDRVLAMEVRKDISAVEQDLIRELLPPLNTNCIPVPELRRRRQPESQ